MKKGEVGFQLSPMILVFFFFFHVACDKGTAGLAKNDHGMCVCVCGGVYSEHLGTLAALSMSRLEGLLCNSSNS